MSVSAHALERVLAASHFALGVVSFNTTRQNQESAGGTVTELLHLETDDEYGQKKHKMILSQRVRLNLCQDPERY